jgi:hypothetical protein
VLLDSEIEPPVSPGAELEPPVLLETEVVPPPEPAFDPPEASGVDTPPLPPVPAV